MKTHPSRYPLLGLLLCLFTSFPAPVRAAGDEWKPIDPAHLSLKNSMVEKEADAEGLFWEVRIDDNPEGDLIFNHYLRVKVFTERGRESQGKIDLPYGSMYASFNSITLHGRSTPWQKDKGGFYTTTMTDMPAVHEESRMPPEDQVKTWMLVYYQTESGKTDPEKYWVDHGKSFYEDNKSLIKANDDVKKLAATLIAEAKSDDEKIARLFDFCRTKIKNISNDASGLTPDERAKLKDNKSPSDTLKRGMGTGGDVDLLFAALANASGLDARIALSPDRGDIFFDKALPNSYFIVPQNIAVNVGGTWKFFNPGYNCLG